MIEKAYNNWEDKYKENIFSKLKLNSQTSRYDYDGYLDKDILNAFFISEDKDGFTINFGKITGEFNCSELGLKSLKGAPTEVGGWFDCSYNQLTSLEGAPQKVGGDFNCHSNQLPSLEGAPTTVGGDFSCSMNKLTSLKGAPREVGENFYCHSNPNLHSLDGIGEVNGKIVKNF